MPPAKKAIRKSPLRKSKHIPPVPPDVNPVGRPTLFTWELANEILHRVQQGESLAQICESDIRFPTRYAIMEWTLRDEGPGFRQLYESAKNEGLDVRAEQLLRIAREPRIGQIETITETSIEFTTGEGDNKVTVPAKEKVRKVEYHDNVARSRLEADVTKWYLGKIAPKRYGEKLQLAGDGGGPLQVQVIDFAKASGEDEE